MNLLFVASNYSGGIGGHAAMLSAQLQKRGHKVDLFHAPHIGIKNLKNPSFAILATLKALASKNQYDIVHAFNVPSALPMHYIKAKGTVLSLHGVYGEQIGIIHSKAAARLANIAERKAMGWADVLTADSKRTVKEYDALGYKFEYLPSAIDTLMFASIKPPTKRPNQVAYVGRDSYEKGTDTLRKIEPEINGTVRYCTNLGWEDAMTVMAESSVLVLPSRMESLPTVVKEAFYLRVPVVATSVGGVPELVQDGKTGFLIKPDDTTRMIRVINEILDGAIDTSEITQSAYEYVTGNMIWEAVMPRYENMYETLLESYRQ